MYHLLSEV
jgi:hypothetical protein